MNPREQNTHRTRTQDLQLDMEVMVGATDGAGRGEHGDERV
jgi:hypothetical protein